MAKSIRKEVIERCVNYSPKDVSTSSVLLEQNYRAERRFPCLFFSTGKGSGSERCVGEYVADRNRSDDRLDPRSSESVGLCDNHSSACRLWSNVIPVYTDF